MRSTLAFIAFISLGLVVGLSSAAPGVFSNPSSVCEVSATGYATIQAAVDDPGCSEVILGAINYAANVTITRNVTIHGQGARKTAVNGGGLGPVFIITSNPKVTLTGMTIRNGNNENAGGGVYIESGTVEIIDSRIQHNIGLLGGGIAIDSGELTVIGTFIVANQTVNGAGGGIYNDQATLTLIESHLSRNQTYFGGGGALENVSGTAQIIGSTLDDNLADWGGGIENVTGLVEIYGSTISNNRADYGAGLFNNLGGNLTVSNSTIGGNMGGAGIYNDGGTIELHYTTIADNTATAVTEQVGGIYNGSGSVAIQSSIVANGVEAADCGGLPVSSGGYNLAGDSSCPFFVEGDQTAVDPRLGPLQANGGPTWTQALQFDSPAIDAADNATCPQSDQRGRSRPSDGDGNGQAICDSGAFELSGSAPVATLTVTPTSTPGPSGTPTPTSFPAHRLFLPIVSQ